LDSGIVGFSNFTVRIYRALKEPGKNQEALKILTELMTLLMIVFDKSKKYR
jgi:hypothetical protein